MDPASIIGTTSAAITFVGTIVKIALIAREVHGAAGGELDEHKQLREVTSALDPGLNALIRKQEAQISLSPEEDSLLKVAKLCKDVAGKTLNLLSHQSFIHQDDMKVTLRIMWDKPEAQELRDAFNMCTTQLNLHLTMISKSHILDRLDAQFTHLREQHSNDIQEIGSALQTTLVDLSGKSNSLIRQIGSMQGQVDQALEAQSTWLSHIDELQKLFKTSHRTMEDIKCHQFLESIAFEDIKLRQREIERVELAENTFEWMVNDETAPPVDVDLSQSFRDWLEYGNGIFHIAGKPGSGKSTLMNFLVDHSSTISQLENWTGGGRKVIVASMFLWNLGSAEQKNLDGVRRTLLHTILSRHKKLIPYAFSAIWNRPNNEQLTLELTSRDIKNALQRLIEDATSEYYYCFFIDGLDEFYDENTPKFSFAAELTRWANHKAVKLCVSSREEQPWTDAFVGFPRLSLHLATKQDIRRMIERFLSDNIHLKTFSQVDYEEFVKAFVDMANGVFIWVKLVLRELADKLDYKASLQELNQVLKTVPQGLDEFYERILQSIPSSDREEAWAVLDIVAETTDLSTSYHFNIYHYSLLHDLVKDPDFYQRSSDYIQSWNDMRSQGHDRIEHFRRRMPFLFHGIVEAIPMGIVRSNEIQPDKLEFAHRSIYEFLKARSFEKRPLPQADNYTMIIKCMIGQVNCYWRKERYPYADFSFVFECLLIFKKSSPDKSIFPTLSLLDEALLRRQMDESEAAFKDTQRVIETAERPFFSAFTISCTRGFHEYLHWVVQSRPSWQYNSLFRALGAEAVSSECHNMHCTPVETLELLFGDGFGPNSWYKHPVRACYMTPWIRFLFSLLETSIDSFFGYRWEADHETYWSVVITFLNHKADLDLTFSWTIEKPAPASSKMIVLKDVTVKVGASQDIPYLETDTLHLKGQIFLIGEGIRCRFPHGASVRELLSFLVPEEVSIKFNNFDINYKSIKDENTNQVPNNAKDEIKGKVGVGGLPVMLFILSILCGISAYTLHQVL